MRRPSAGWLINGQALVHENLAEQILLQRDSAGQEWAPLAAELQQVREGIPETAMTYKQAVGLKKQLMADPAFVDGAIKGGQAEREKLLLIDIILSGPVRLENR